jgi:hypothetical protein
MDVRLGVRPPSCGAPFPDTLADHDGVVALGGPRGANDTLDWVRRGSSGSKLRSPRTNRCSLSASVRQCWRERSAQWCSGTTTSVSRLAITQSTPTLVGDRLCPALFPRAVYQGHSDGFDLPRDAELLAVGGRISPTRPIALAACGRPLNQCDRRTRIHQFFRGDQRRGSVARIHWARPRSRKTRAS